MKILEFLKLFGPNRHADDTVFEGWIRLSDDELASLDDAAMAVLAAAVSAKFAGHDAALVSETAPGTPPAGPPARQYAALIARIALVVQRLGGHRVSFHDSPAAGDGHVACFVVEYEHGDDGLLAINLALRLLAELHPDIRVDSADDMAPFDEGLATFLAKAPGHLLPGDCHDIIEVARRLDIPCVKLDRDPYEGVAGDFRIRRHGMLKLGHACRQRIIDGTLPIDQGERLPALALDRAAVREALESMNLPLPPGRFCSTSRQARRAAEQIGYPLIVKPARYNRARTYGHVSAPLHDAEALQEAAHRCLQSSPGVLVEAFVKGQTWQALVANGELIAVLKGAPGEAISAGGISPHPETRTLAETLARSLDAPLLAVTLVGGDIASPPGSGLTLVEADVAPELDGLLGDASADDAKAILRKACEGLLNHLFPASRPSRIPIVAVTGTNGKTTVCAMLEAILQAAGRSVGRAGTNGVYIDGELIVPGDQAGGKGHNRVLESPRVDTAVLEAARGAASGFGLMFDACDVAVCTNVSEDHLGERGIDTVEQMAAFKLFIVQRARRAVVLNVDNTFSAGMLEQLPGRRAWLTSTRADAAELRRRFPGVENFCLVEPGKDGAQVVLLAGEKREAVIKVSDMPATLDGAAGFNVSNALQAISAAHEMGADLASIRRAMGQFVTDFEHNPGRMNFYEGHPFRVLLDFAHNIDGYLALRSIVDALEVSGRRILAYTCRGSMPDKTLMKISAVLAPGFDHFIIYDNPKQAHRKPGEVAAILENGLIDAGVPKASVEYHGGPRVIDRALRMARPGDLLVMTTVIAAQEDDWHRITRFQYPDEPTMRD